MATDGPASGQERQARLARTPPYTINPNHIRPTPYPPENLSREPQNLLHDPTKRPILTQLGPNPSQPLKPLLRHGNRRKRSTTFSLNPRSSSTSPRHPAPPDTRTRIPPPPPNPSPGAYRAGKGLGGRVSRPLPAGACSVPHGSWCRDPGLAGDISISYFGFRVSIVRFRVAVFWGFPVSG